MDYLSSCMIVKDEEQYLQEIIIYNILQGIEHQYIYNNGNELKGFERFKDYITIIDFPGEAKQMKAYLHCLNNYGDRTKWLFIHDADEFVFCKDKTFKEFLNKYEYFGGVGINWRMFGSSGKINKPDGLVIENYDKHVSCFDKVSNHIKTVCQPRFVRKDAMKDPHHVLYRSPTAKWTVNENMIPVFGPFSNYSSNKIQLNHYWTKSLEEFKGKIERGTADGTPKRTLDMFYDFDKKCDNFDDAIKIYIDKIKEFHLYE